MKTTHIAMVAGIAFGLALAACKKENPSDPINKSGEEDCSFCISSMIEVDTTGTGNWYGEMTANSLITPTDFYHRDGSSNTPGMVSQTPDGIYGISGMSLALDFSGMLACAPNKLSFAHARFATNTNEDPSFVNIKLPDTPVIACVADSLDYYLAPYGYTVQHYFYPGIVTMNMNNDQFNGVVDSLVVTGPEFTAVTVGANLFESELRNICVYHQ